MKTLIFLLTSAFVLASGTALACGQCDEHAKGASTTVPKHLAGYESVRAALAGDDLKAAKSSAVALAAETRKKAHGGNHEAIAAAADRIAGAADIAAARLAFGDMSKEFIRMLVAMPTMAKGVTAYECPMAKGYKKWIQAGGEMTNPYKGKKMLHCGHEVDLAV